MKIILILAALMGLAPNGNNTTTKVDVPKVIESATYKKSLNICKEMSDDKKSFSNESDEINQMKVLLL